jgi:hypothetical protein
MKITIYGWRVKATVQSCLAEVVTTFLTFSRPALRAGNDTSVTGEPASSSALGDSVSTVD